jgi:Protein of unknown function (DUF2798)
MRTRLNENLKKELLFSLLTTIGMVAIMQSYNVIMVLGFTATAASEALRQFIPVFLVAFVVQRFVISHNAFALHKIIVSPQDSQLKYIVALTGLMVTGMCTSMTLYASPVNVGTENDFWRHYFEVLARNYPVALIAQMFVVGPLVRPIHTRVFQPSALVN